MKGEKVVLHIPECEKCGRVSGRIEHYDLILTATRIIGARAGRNSLAASGILARLSADGQTPRISSADVDRILALDRNNFAIPLANFHHLDVTRALGQPYIRFKLNGCAPRSAAGHAVPRELAFDGKYMAALEAAIARRQPATPTP